jgi:hypothetical protein
LERFGLGIQAAGQSHLGKEGYARFRAQTAPRPGMVAKGVGHVGQRDRLPGVDVKSAGPATDAGLLATPQIVGLAGHQ